MTNTSNLIPLEDFCKEKGIVRQTAYRLIKAGTINAVNIGYARFILNDKKAKAFQKTIKIKQP